jgi:hypothetical protein
MISTTTQRISYSGDGSNDTFAVPFRWDAFEWIEVYVDDVLLTTGYALTGEGEDNGGSVEITTPPPVGVDNVVIVRVTPLTQVEHLTTVGPFASLTVERQMIDKLCMMVQDIYEILGRCVKFPVTSTFKDVTLPDPESGKLLAWNADLDALINALVGTVTEGSTPVIVVAISAGAGTAVIPHSLGVDTAKLIGWSTTWHTTLKVVSQAVNAMTVEFGTEPPPLGAPHTLIAQVTL